MPLMPVVNGLTLIAYLECTLLRDLATHLAHYVAGRLGLAADTSDEAGVAVSIW